MSCPIGIDPRAQDAIAALPAEALLALAEALAVLELAPGGAGRSVNPDLNPDAAVRNLPFGGTGMITYLVLERDRRVDVLLITWA